MKRMVIDVSVRKYDCAAAFIICFITSVLIMFSGTNIGVRAEKTGSVTLVCESRGESLSGMTWRFYHAGKRSGNTIVPSGNFSGYKVTFGDLSADALMSAASTLESYAVLDGITPNAEGVTDSDGQIRFADLEPGIYLVCGDKLTVGKGTYTPAPMFVEVSESNPDMTAYPKFTYQDVLGADTERFRLMKIWENDEEFPQDRSASINVEIYCNSVLKETVTLSEENDWTYSWTAKISDVWRVKEINIPEHYTVIYRSNENQFVVVNTHDEDIPPVTTTTTTATTTLSGTTTGTSVTDTTTATDVRTTVTTVRQTESKLPQTGQLWWPVPILAIGGIIFVGIGCRLVARSKKEDD